MRIAFVSPFTNTTNRYIDMQKQLLSDCGFDVKPLNVKSVLTGRAWGIFKRDNVMAFHWLETRPYVWRGANPSLSLKGSVEFLFYVVLIAIARARVVYFVHDHAVHDTTGWRKKLSVQLIKLLRALADTRVVHDPSFAGTYQATYLPHPLYWDDGHTNTKPMPAAARGSEQTQFGMLGAVRPYKNIHRILEIWPQGVRLMIRGRATDDYAAQLNEVIARRQLAPHVAFQSGYMSDEDFAASLAALDVLILAHISDSMLVSGAFFEAIGRVSAIWARQSPFIKWAASQLPNALPFKDDAELVERVVGLKSIPANRGTAEAQADKALAAIRLFGWKECVRSYSAMLNNPSPKKN
ncbi:glycosyltransferase [Aquabacterium sp.]|uniref:glycosyltransferase n=1 Tax=Aquabacterium sp. TaxID=1872578 RepID=UPI0019C505B6|nr:glycosyltransferase [Aquabacterium sp.]MBC7700161.1 glycosyltransferase [Aquabacterium sp.]